MKTALVILAAVLLIAGIVFYVLGHYQIAFGIGAVLILLFIRGNAFYSMENREYLRKKAANGQKKERESWRKK